MSGKTYELTFDGYWRERNAGGIPARSGIYCVYGCVHNAQAGTVTIKRLIYIGEAANMKDRVAGHEKRARWKRQLGPGEELCFNAAPIGPQSDRERAEAAIIFRHKPPCNEEYVNSFPYERTSVTTGGKNALLAASFTVEPTQARSALAGRW